MAIKLEKEDSNLDDPIARLKLRFVTSNEINKIESMLKTSEAKLKLLHARKERLNEEVECHRDKILEMNYDDLKENSEEYLHETQEMFFLEQSIIEGIEFYEEQIKQLECDKKRSLKNLAKIF